MKEVTNAKLISDIEQEIRIFERPSKKNVTELLRRFKEINCLEAKPKALHSMKCDEKVCCYELNDEEFLNTKVSDTCKCNKDECKHEVARPSRGH